MTSIADQVREFVSRHLITLDDQIKWKDEDNLFALGLVDSPFAMQLVAFLEERFQIRVADEDLDIANFNSISCITAFVNRKLKP